MGAIQFGRTIKPQYSFQNYLNRHRHLKRKPAAHALPQYLSAGWRTCSLYRLSFSGELAYEIVVRRNCGERLMETILEAGKADELCPYGLEALNVLRIQKGHVTAAELNGQTTATDVGMGGLMSKTKDFVGRPLASRPALVASDRMQLVGLKPIRETDTFSAGADLFAEDQLYRPETDLGHITPVCYSPHMGHHIGLALLKNGRVCYGASIQGLRCTARSGNVGLGRSAELC